MSKKKTAKKYEKPVDYFKNFYEWPKDWMGAEEDLIIGIALLTQFTPFIESLIKQGLAVKTIKHHMGNLAVLGSEIIRRLNDGDEKNRNLPPRRLLLEYIDDQHGPLVDHWDPNDSIEETHLKAFDSTCRKLFKFTSASI